MTIKPIETHYAGCRFRSRLEARWAVFFDTLGIEWEYEPQGHLVNGRPYLPDFWLPGEKLWVEVKGDADQLDLPLMLAAAIPHEGVGLPDSRNESRLLVLGPVPRPGPATGHSALVFYKGDVWRVWAEFTDTGLDVPHVCAVSGDDNWLGNDGLDVATPDPPLTASACLNENDAASARVLAAYAIARSARFEHGEQP